MVHIDDVPAIEPQAKPYGAFFRSPLGWRHNVGAEPLIVFGHDAPAAAHFIAQATVLSTLAVRSLQRLDQALAVETSAGVFAQSPRGRPGEAARAIRMFRDRCGSGKAAFYGAWTTDVAQAATRAAAAGADGLIMPDSDAGEMFDYMFAVLKAAHAGEPPPADAAAFIRQLKVGFARSPFWFAQADVVDDY